MRGQCRGWGKGRSTPDTAGPDPMLLALPPHPPYSSCSRAAASAHACRLLGGKARRASDLHRPSRWGSGIVPPPPGAAGDQCPTDSGCQSQALASRQDKLHQPFATKVAGWNDILQKVPSECLFLTFLKDGSQLVRSRRLGEKRIRCALCTYQG